jgi:hypothetical protein
MHPTILTVPFDNWFECFENTVNDLSSANTDLEKAYSIVKWDGRLGKGYIDLYFADEKLKTYFILRWL